MPDFMKITNLSDTEWAKITGDSINVDAASLASVDGKLSLSPNILKKLDGAAGKITKLEFIVNELIEKLKKYEDDPLDFLKKKIGGWELK